MRPTTAKRREGRPSSAERNRDEAIKPAVWLESVSRESKSGNRSFINCDAPAKWRSTQTRLGRPQAKGGEEGDQGDRQPAQQRHREEEGAWESEGDTIAAVENRTDPHERQSSGGLNMTRRKSTLQQK